MKLIKICLLTTTIFLIAACGSSEPSENDITEAIHKHFKAQLEESTGVFQAEDIKIHHIRKVDCREAKQKGGYFCDVDVNIDVKLPFIGTQNQNGVQSLRFVNADDGWSIVQ